jgi:acetyltransferase-like isoleucine patch superfamily enzyme
MWTRARLKNYYLTWEREQPWLADWAYRFFHGGFWRRIQYRLRGKKHEINIHRSAICQGVTFDLGGSSHYIEIGPRCILRNVLFKFSGESHRAILGERVKFIHGGSIHMEDDAGELKIGAKTTFEDTHLAVTGHGKKILIGSDCMFAYDIDVRTGDSHAIVNAAGQKINDERDIILGEHVWVASHCTILKGTEIGENSIVATRSTVTAKFGKNIVLGGSPARLLKEGVSWRRERFIT